MESNTSPMDDGKNFTQIMQRVRDGHEEARDEALSLVFTELKALASRRLFDQHTSSFEATDLINEAYARLTHKGALDWQNRRHFFSLAARAMRDILVERARARGAFKRGGDWQRVSMVSAVIGAEQNASGFLALDEAIDRLSSAHPSCGDVVKLTYFGGLTVAESALALDVSASTVDRLLRFSRSWLLKELTNDP